MLVIGGVEIDNGTFKALGDAAGHQLVRGRRRPNLLAIVISKTFAVEPTVENGRVIIQFAHMSRIRSNPEYAGNLRFVGRWNGEWRLDKVG